MADVICIRTRRPIGETPRRPWLTMPKWPPAPLPRRRRSLRVVLHVEPIEPPIVIPGGGRRNASEAPETTEEPAKEVITSEGSGTR